MTHAVIAAYGRSPFTLSKKGELARFRSDDLAAQTIKGLMDRLDVDPQSVEDVIMGCTFPEGEQGFNIARLTGLAAGLPQCVGGVTVNRFCGSSMQGVHMAAGAIAAGAGEAFVCAGVESMTRIPMGGYNPLPNPAFYKVMPDAYASMGETAENVSARWNIDRKTQEEFALASQQKAAKAQAEGRLRDEIIPVTHPRTGAVVDQDGCIRADTTLEGLAGLKPAFNDKGVVTAGTSSPLTDGASAVFVCSDDYAKRHNLTPLAVVRSFAISGCDPAVMGIGPVASTQKALKRAGLSVDDMDIIELNEAFAAQALACIHDLKLDLAKINLDGGAIALGHPLGATGARIVGKAASLLVREKKKYALATQCIGGGQGIATVLEAV